MSDKTLVTLVFPAVNQAAFDYVDAALERGETVHCAASISLRTFDFSGVITHELPQIYDDNFLTELRRLVSEHQIQNIVCPVLMVHDYVQRLIQQEQIALRLIGKSPIQVQMEQHRRLMKKTRSITPFMNACADNKKTLNEINLAGILRYASLVYGESNDDKLVAMAGIMGSAPKGDVIEIGSLMGRSAFVLSYAAWYFGLGSLLTIDPWDFKESIQTDSPENLKDMSGVWDFEILKEGFFVNLVPTCNSSHVHLRMPSEDAYPIYVQQDAIRNRNDELVSYSGKISVIHIDGNHDFESVKKDCDLWLNRMQADSWLILDDYIWAHGDGPYRIGNEFLATQSQRVKRAFVCGKALFIQFAS
jgi:hypothetical protein